jgi:hypothetical protein
MPIRRELRALYGSDWRRLSDRIRFGRAGGRCERCCRPHGRAVWCLPDGRWCEAYEASWFSELGIPVDSPAGDWHAWFGVRLTFVVLTTAHLDHDPRNRDPDNLAALCQRCHLRHDAASHRTLRWLTWRARHAAGDLFLGRYSDVPYPPRDVQEALEAARRSRQ